MSSPLLFAPALFFGLVALLSSALAFRGDGLGDREEMVVRNRHATLVAVVAAVLCALSLLAGAGLLILQALPGD
ncbi:MAG TPA: hypothetical protein VFN18_07600 [Solirubrobacterales bacterium]|nr:hypothetical protein [Solirubrobacterales bacterium]